MNTPIPNDSEEYLTKEELSDRLKLSVRTVVRWMKEGRVPFHRFGSKTVRFKWSRVQKALEERERPFSAEHGAGSMEDEKQRSEVLADCQRTRGQKSEVSKPQ